MLRIAPATQNHLQRKQAQRENVGFGANIIKSNFLDEGINASLRSLNFLGPEAEKSRTFIDSLYGLVHDKTARKIKFDFTPGSVGSPGNPRHYDIIVDGKKIVENATEKASVLDGDQSRQALVNFAKKEGVSKKSNATQTWGMVVDNLAVALRHAQEEYNKAAKEELMGLKKLINGKH